MRSIKLLLFLVIVFPIVLGGFPSAFGVAYDQTYPCREVLPVHIPGERGTSQVLHIDVPDDVSDATNAVLTVEVYDVDWKDEATLYVDKDRYSLPVTGNERTGIVQLDINLKRVQAEMELRFTYERRRSSWGYDVYGLYLTVTFSGEDNRPPVADAGDEYAGSEGMPLPFDASGSYDPDGTIDNYTWDFGDGTMGSGVNPSHHYDADGVYTVTLTVTDDKGGIDTDTSTAIVYDTEPAAAFSATPLAGAPPLTVIFVDESSSFDRIVAWHWDFGDGEHSTYQHPIHIYREGGVYTVSLTVTEVDGDNATARHVDYVSLQDLNPPMVASIILDPSNPETIQIVNFNVTVYDVGGAGLANVSLYVDDEIVDTWTTLGSHVHSAGPYPAGEHTCFVEALDTAGNRITTDPQIFTVILPAFRWSWLMYALVLAITFFAISYHLLLRRQ